MGSFKIEPHYVRYSLPKKNDKPTFYQIRLHRESTDFREVNCHRVHMRFLEQFYPIETYFEENKISLHVWHGYTVFDTPLYCFDARCDSKKTLVEFAEMFEPYFMRFKHYKPLFDDMGRVVQSPCRLDYATNKWMETFRDYEIEREDNPDRLFPFALRVNRFVHTEEIRALNTNIENLILSVPLRGELRFRTENDLALAKLLLI